MIVKQVPLLDFLFSALDIRSDRDYADILHVETSEENTLLVTVDGKRMHVVEGESCYLPVHDAGDYSMRRISAKEFSPEKKEVVFPDWKRALPESNTLSSWCNPYDSPKGYFSTDLVIETFKLNGARVYEKYLRPLQMNYPVEIFAGTDPCSPMSYRITAGKAFLTAVIMPYTQKGSLT